MTITIKITRRFVLVTAFLFVSMLLLATRFQATASSPDAAATPCPKVEEPRISMASVLRLERGYMVWLGDKRIIYVMYYDAGSTTKGTFETYAENWEEGMPERDDSIVAPPGLWQPSRGFGKLWRENTKVRQGVGWGLSDSSGYMAVVAQQGSKLWFNGRDNAFKIEGDHWEDIYAWRK